MPQSGFNLIEAAIVLRIVGLFVNSIWTAASSLRERQKIEETVSGTLVMARYLQNNISAYAGALIPCCADITPIYAASNNPPAGWRLTNGNFYTPVGGWASVASFGNRFDFALEGFTQSQCIQFISRMSALLQHDKIGSNWTIVYTNAYGGSVTLSLPATSFPYKPTTSECVSSGTNAINLITYYIYN